MAVPPFPSWDFDHDPDMKQDKRHKKTATTQGHRYSRLFP
jgi:hypothetical protein